MSSSTNDKLVSKRAIYRSASFHYEACCKTLNESVKSKNEVMKRACWIVWNEARKAFIKARTECEFLEELHKKEEIIAKTSD
jgi:hypothetical protein